MVPFFFKYGAKVVLLFQLCKKFGHIFVECNSTSRNIVSKQRSPTQLIRCTNLSTKAPRTQGNGLAEAFKRNQRNQERTSQFLLKTEL